MTFKTHEAPSGVKRAALPVQSGEVRDIALNRLLASPDNVRRVGHSAADIESRAASIKAKGVIQPLVVKPKLKEDGGESGYYLVSVGEGRRQALKLLAKRKVIGKAALVRCVVDTVNDAAEISLDENLSRRNMHPADEFEAFREQAERRGFGAEEIAARFGVTPQLVRQRLRLGAVAPALLDLYREEALTLEQLMAFAVNPDPERQMQVYARLAPHQRQTYAIRRAMTEAKVPADDRRAVFIGLDAYVAAGGTVLADLFTEAGQGWLEDVALLDRLVEEKLSAIAVQVRQAEGWKWTGAYLAHPYGHGWSRIWEKPLPLSAEVQARIEAMRAEQAELTDRYADLEDLPPQAQARHAEIDAALAALGEDFGYDPAEKARAGAIVVLGEDGQARVGRGFVRPEDEPAPDPEDEDEAADAADQAGAEASLAAGDDEGDPEEDAPDAEPAEEPTGDASAPLSAWLRAELTAHRSAALRHALAENPDLALIALLHVLVLRVFTRTGVAASCLAIHMGSHDLSAEGGGVEDSRAGIANAARHAAWARQVPDDAGQVWDFVVGLDGDSRASLLAHCVALSLNAVHGFERRPLAWAHADVLASALGLDMSDWWSPTAERYLDGVTKAHVLAAVGEAVSPEAAARLAGLKKPDMVAAAQPQLVAARWLPALLRTPRRAASLDPSGSDEAACASPVQAGEAVADAEAEMARAD